MDLGQRAVSDLLLDVVASDVDVKLSVEAISACLEQQLGAGAVTSVVRFKRTSKGKPPSPLPLVRVFCADEAVRSALLREGALINGTRSKTALPVRAKDSAAARGKIAVCDDEQVERAVLELSVR